MSESLNVVALISGGKDSLFSILHCLEHGHQVVALANLYPNQNIGNAAANTCLEVEAEAGEDDLNSFMYQTVGHSVIPLYADCLGIPLYRRSITGSVVQTGRYYDSSGFANSADETEDLVPLLKEIRQAHPEANALCSGAILSTYQRTRVESVAVRLGLIPLAYLWQYPALPPPIGRGECLAGLLDDMAAAGCEARIIKIASGGIKESLMWSNVADPRTQLRLLDGLRPFFPDCEFELRGAVLGEGGEYETLAISGPRRLWKRKIHMSEDGMSTFTAEGGVGYLRFGDARTVDNETMKSENEMVSLRIPENFDYQFQSVVTNLGHQGMLSCGQHAPSLGEAENKQSRTLLKSLLRVSKTQRLHCSAISNLMATDISSARSHSTSAAAQMKQICDNLKSSLNQVSSSSRSGRALTPADIVSTILLLKDMSNFSAVNSVYASLFRAGEPNPPARVTVACSLPEEVQVCLSVILDLGPQNARRGLHIQSRSYWAPANIGPYSQAICVPLHQDSYETLNGRDGGNVEMVHVAGQIPLVPQTMQVSNADFPEQAILSLQHLWRVGQERGVDIWPWGIVFLAQSPNGPSRAESACRVWQQIHLTGTSEVKATAKDGEEDEEGPDAWDLRYNRALTSKAPTSQLHLGQHLHLLPNPAVYRDADAVVGCIPPFVAAEVGFLPQDCPIEWWSMGIAHLPKAPLSEPRISVNQWGYIWGSISITTILPHSGKATERSIHLVTVLVHRAATSTSNDNFESVENDLLAILSSEETSTSVEDVSGTAFVSTQSLEDWSRIKEHQLFQGLVFVPCNSVHGCSNFSGDTFNTGDSDGATSALTQPLAVAITMKVDK